MDRRLKIHELILPVIVPSWRFFDVVKPAPRIEYCFMQGDEVPVWQEFRPRPARLSLSQQLRALFYNPQWNEYLFLMSCAERIIKGQIEHSVETISSHILSDIDAAYGTMQFRLNFVSRIGGKIHEDILYTSRLYDVGAA